MRRPRRPSHTAYHEAGHAVAAWALGLRTVYATILSTVDMEGHVRGERTDRSDLVGVVAFAGPAAQRRSHPRSNIGHSSSMDRDTVTLAAADLFSALHHRTSYIRRADRDARWLVERHWLAVDAVARELAARGALSGFAIEGLIREAEEEWAAVSRSRPGVSPFRYAQERYKAVHGLAKLRRSQIEAAALRAMLAGAGDIEEAIGADLVDRGYRAADVAALLQRIRSTAA